MAVETVQVKYSDLYRDGITVRSDDISQRDLVLLANTGDRGASYTSKVAEVQDFQNRMLATSDVLKPDQSSLKMVYQQEGSKYWIKLLANGTTQLGAVDCSDFMADGMLTDVTYDRDTNQLVFTFNTSHPQTEPISISLSSLASSYEADDVTIKRTGNVFSCTDAMASVQTVRDVSAAVNGSVSDLRTDYTSFKQDAIDAEWVLSGRIGDLSADLSAVSAAVRPLTGDFSDLIGRIDAVSCGLSSKLDVSEEGIVAREIAFAQPVIMSAAVQFSTEGAAPNAVLVTNQYSQVAFSGIAASKLETISALTGDAQAQITALSSEVSAAAPAISALSSSLSGLSASFSGLRSSVQLSVAGVRSDVDSVMVSAAQWNSAASLAQQNRQRLDSLGGFAAASYEVLSEAKYEDLSSRGELDAGRFYFVTDNADTPVTLVFTDTEGTEITSVETFAGQTVDGSVAPPIPDDRPYYDPAGWTDESSGRLFTVPFTALDDAVLVQTYTPKTYTVTFADGPEVISAISESYTPFAFIAADYVEPPQPVEPGEVSYWDPDMIPCLTSDFTFSLSSYHEGDTATVTFRDIDGNVLSAYEDVQVGTGFQTWDVQAPDVPGYEFTGWRYTSGRELVTDEPTIYGDTAFDPVYVVLTAEEGGE